MEQRSLVDLNSDDEMKMMMMPMMMIIIICIPSQLIIMHNERFPTEQPSLVDLNLVQPMLISPAQMIAGF